MANARKTAVKALLQVEKSGAYSNLTLNKLLSESEHSSADRALATALFYGVLDRRITLDYVLSLFLSKPIKRLSPYTAAVLRSALYQIMYMERIPNSAAVNEAVKLIKASKEKFNASFVNGVLRNILRSEINSPEDDSISSLSVRFSCPESIVESFISDYGADTAKELLRSFLEAPPVVLQVNTLRTNAASLAEKLLNEGTAASVSEDGNTLVVTDGIDVRASKCYREGLFFIQDNASRRAIEKMAPRMGERVLDLCAAPGGKSFAAARLMQGKGEIYSFDLYEKRVELIALSAKRLGFENIKAAVGDATVYNGDIGTFDAVICDVPCSGLGVLRRKPEIKYKSEQEWDALPALQLEILENAARYLKENGRILYSTCTLRHSENQKVTNKFLDKHTCFALKYEHTYMPHIDETDGFYCALLEKKGN